MENHMTPLPNISTGDLKADQSVFLNWYGDIFIDDLSPEQFDLTELISRSFHNLRTMNKDNPAAWAKLKELHDADVAKLQAMLRPLED